MDKQVDRLVDKTWELYHSFDDSRRLIIGIAGIPGSGKTTLASTIHKRINARYHAYQQSLHPNSSSSLPIVPDICASLPLDGYHLTRAELSAMPNAEEAHYRRGAAFTFNGQKFLDLVEKLHQPILPETHTIKAPSFDHAVKDPKEDDISIPPSARIVIIEGLYVALSTPPWCDAAELMDELWFIDVPIPVAAERVAKRHVKAGLSPDIEHARKRVDESDMRNGREVLENRLPLQEFITSEEDQKWAPEQISNEQAKALEEEEHQSGAKEEELEVKEWNKGLQQNIEEEKGKSNLENGKATGRPHVQRGATSLGSLAELAQSGGGC